MSAQPMARTLSRDMSLHHVMIGQGSERNIPDERKESPCTSFNGNEKASPSKRADNHRFRLRRIGSRNIQIRAFKIRKKELLTHMASGGARLLRAANLAAIVGLLRVNFLIVTSCALSFASRRFLSVPRSASFVF